MKKWMIVMGVLFFLAGNSYASTVAEDCGCGLGKAAIGEKQGLGWNLLGTFLNGLCGNQTFGMTSGTLECGTDNSIVINEKLDAFVADNMDTLAVDIAVGGGESIDALVEIAQLNPAQLAPLAATLQAQFDTIYPDANVSHTHVVSTIQGIIAEI